MLILTDSAVTNGDGDAVLFKDTTGTTAPYSYGKNGNITYSDVDCVRIKVATVDSVEEVTTLETGDTLTQYVEYIVTEGSAVTIDGKVLSAGNTITPQIAGLTVPASCTLETTGYYSYPVLATWLPTSGETALTLTKEQLNQADNTYVANALYLWDYTIYKDKFNSTTAAVSGNQYIVMTSTATYNGSTYRAGEYFIASTTGNIVPSGYVAIMDSTKTTYFTLTYSLTNSLAALVPTASEATMDRINKIQNQLFFLSFSCQTNNVNFTYTQGLIDKFEAEILYLTNNN